MHLRADGSLVSVVGRLFDPGRRSRDARFTLAPDGALSSAVRARYGVDVTARSTADKATLEAGAWAPLDVTAKRGLRVTGARARRVYVEREGILVPAYAVEHFGGDGSTTDAGAFLDVVHATSGETLETRDLVADDAFAYRVFADADGEPLAGPHEDVHPVPTEMYYSFPGPVAPTLHVVESRKTLPLGAVDPWLPADATETLGNHAESYTDLTMPDGLNGSDFRASTTAPGTFDHVFDLGAVADGESQRMAAITNAFYVVNTLHDYWYDSGFDEVAGNAQADNFGRGGVGGDRMRVEIQDNVLLGNRNNANMATPADGSSPRMQIFLWTMRQEATVQTTSPAGEPIRAVGASTFAPRSFDVSGELVVGDDGTDVATDGCQAIVNDVVGKIALVDRGNCDFVLKATNAQTAGAIGVVIANDRAATVSAMGGAGVVTIPALLVAQGYGAELRDALEVGPVSVRMHSVDGPHERDGALDATLVQHEWGHYLHNRLADCFESQCRAMGEGWGDFVALHAQVREGDDPAGAYGLAVHAVDASADPTYLGLRRVPYSTDRAKNALTFGHIADSATLPDLHPVQDVGSPNSEVHNAGEVWTTVLFDAYAALLDAHPFDEAKRRFANAIVASLLLSPPDATYVEARDALLEALAATDMDDALAVAQTFADRGLGTCAVAPDRASVDFTDLEESFELAPDVVIADIELDAVESCDDDGYLDVGEVGAVRVTLANTGAADATPTVTVAPGAALVIDDASKEVVVPALSTVVVTFDARVAESVAGATSVELTVTADPAPGCGAPPAPAVLARSFRVHADAVAGASASTRFAAGVDELAIMGERAESIWSHVELPGTLDGAIVGIDFSSKSDTALVTPAIVVGAGAFTVALEHRHRFESSDGFDWDGLVVEVSTDDGDTWADASAFGTVPYTGTIQSDFPDAEQVLSGQPAFVGTNASYPETDEVVIDFGTALAGETIRLRFRIGTDAASGDEGWELRAVTLSGATNTPFRALVGEVDACNSPEPEEDGGVVVPPSDGGVVVPPSDGGVIDEPDAGGGTGGGAGGGSSGGGCGCAAAGGPSSAGDLLPLLVAGLVLARRRRVTSARNRRRLAGRSAELSAEAMASPERGSRPARS